MKQSIPLVLHLEQKPLITNTNSINFKDGNLALAISDHPAQFLIIQEDSYKTLYIHDFKNFDRETFLLDLLAIT